MNLGVFLSKVNGANVGISIRDMPIFIGFFPFAVGNGSTKDHLVLFMRLTDGTSIGHYIISRICSALTRMMMIWQLALTLKIDARILLEGSQDDAR